MEWVRVALKKLPKPHQYWCSSGKPPQRTLWEGAQAAGIVRCTRAGMVLRGVAFAPIAYDVLANEPGQRGGTIDTGKGWASGLAPPCRPSSAARATVTPPLQRSFRAPPPSIAHLRPPSRLSLMCDSRSLSRLLELCSCFHWRQDLQTRASACENCGVQIATTATQGAHG